MASAPLVIKKYGNRRLYDTEASRYITLEDLAGVIRSGRDVKVVDAKTNADLTKSVLLQIISDQEKDRDLLPVSFLKRMIQLRDSAVRESLQRYLSVSLESFLNAQQDFEQRYRDLAGNLMNPMMWMMPQLARMAGMSPEQTPPAAEPSSAEAPPPPEEPDNAAGAADKTADTAAPPAPPEVANGEPVEPAAKGPADPSTQAQIASLKAQVAQIAELLAKLEK
jgi:polyhydroxyalkanoate synthesis repressor PhaR